MPLSTLLNTVSPWQVTLRAGAELNAHWVNLYTLTLWATCPGEDKVEKQLFVWVKEGQVLHCDAPFTSAGRSRRYGVEGATGAGQHCAPTAMLCCRGRCGAGAGRCGASDTPVCCDAAATRGADGEWGLPWGPQPSTGGSSPGDAGTPGAEEGDRGSHHPSLCSSDSETTTHRSCSPIRAWCWHLPVALTSARAPRWAAASPGCHSHLPAHKGLAPCRHFL